MTKIVFDMEGNQFQVINDELFPVEDPLMEHPVIVQQELYELVLKSARRCAYDLKHASDDIPRDVLFCGESRGEMWNNQGNSWIKIFQPDGMKDYRHRLHREIDIMDIKITGYQRILKEHGIDDDTIEIPF